MQDPPDETGPRPGPEEPVSAVRRRAVDHPPLKRWSPISSTERKETRAFVELLTQFPYLTVSTVVFLGWAYVVQLMVSWPMTWILPPGAPSEILVTEVLGDRLGWLDASAVAGGEAWRLLSATMLHGSVLHVVGNCVVLFFLGRVVENTFGRAAFLSIYVLSGLTASSLSVLAVGSNSLGSSGAVLGLLGAALALGIRHKGAIPRPLQDFFRVDLWALVVLFALLSALPMVDWAGHLGGFLGGLAVGMLWPPVVAPGEPGPVRRILGSALVALSLSAFLWSVVVVGTRISTLPEHMPTEDLRALQSAMERGDSEAQRAVALRLLERFPETPSLQVEIAMVLLEVGEFQVAAELLLEVEESSPRYELLSNYWDNNVAWALFMAYPDDSERVDEGLVRVRSALKSDPDNAVMKNTLAYGLYLDGEPARAEQTIRLVMQGKSEAERGDDIYIHVLSLAAVGRTAEALKSYRAALDRYPDGVLREEATAELVRLGLLPPQAPAPPAN
ncbi:MAG: rhomboid family intramembrane serine protease [Myxococcota bacterium]|nr:rhomboid family intramembrane serine protease [Myxococcota bacterium]